VSHRVHRIILALGVLTAALALTAGSVAAVSSTIRAYFDADGHLMFTYADGSQVSGTIPPGTYQVIYDNLGADDLAVDHAFHLFGPGIDFAPAASVVHSTFNVAFAPNATYTLRDDLHPAIGGRTFMAVAGGSTAEPSVGGGGGGSTPTPSTSKPVSNDVVGTDIAKSTSKAFRGTLAGAVSAAGKLTLTYKGKPVNSLKYGRYTFAIDDRSPTKAFKVQRLKGSPIAVTGVKSVGKKNVTLTLDAGQWWFSSGGPTKTFFAVTR